MEEKTETGKPKAPKINWQRIIITVGIVLIVSCALSISVWYLMNEQSKKDKATNDQKVEVLQKQIDELRDSESNSNNKDSKISSIDSDWNLYTNYNDGYSIKIPVKANGWYGGCSWATKDNDNSYRPADGLISTKVFEKSGVANIDFEYFYKLTGEKAQPDGTYKYSGCEKVVNTFNTVNGEAAKSWRIQTASAKNDNELNTFLKKYGSSCSLGEKKQVSDDLYSISIKGDGLGLEDTKCPVNYATSIFYSPSKQKVYYWNLGQSSRFTSADTNTSYDLEMVDSFKLIK